MREKPEHLRDYFLERLWHYSEHSINLPLASYRRYNEKSALNGKNYAT